MIRRFPHIVTFSLVDHGCWQREILNSSQDRSGTEVLPPKISRLREVLLLAGIDCPGSPSEICRGGLLRTLGLREWR